MVKPVYLDTSVPAGVEVVNPMEVLDPTGCLVTDSRLLQPGVGSDVTVPIGQHRAARPWLRWERFSQPQAAALHLVVHGLSAEPAATRML
jgi:hypothetical protein